MYYSFFISWYIFEVKIGVNSLAMEEIQVAM